MNSRRILLFVGVVILAVAALIGGLALYINSPAFKARAEEYVVGEIQRRTGASVTLKNLDWSFWHERFRLDDLTLRGLEPATDEPLAHFKRIDIGLKFRTLLERKIDLFELTFSEPEFHVIVSPDGKTNIPSPESRPGGKPFEFEISIENFNIIGGNALLNERRVNLDFSTRNLAAVLNYRGARQVLETHLRYDGVLDRSSEGMPSIPYTFAGDMDYTRGTLIGQRIVLTSGPTQLRLQGRINQLLSRNISGRLAYTGNVQVPFLNYFFTKEKFGGKSAVAGFLEFSSGYFFTLGNAACDAVDFEGWHATKFTGEYQYRYPDRVLTVRKLKNGILGGSVAGEVSIDHLPGAEPSRVSVNIDYANIDAAAMARAYPWDPKYRIFSNATGTLKGWFEGKLTRFDFGGHADLTSYAPAAVDNLVPLPLDGSTDYQLRPGQAQVANANLRLYSTNVKADGLIDATMSDLKVALGSSNLKDIAFVYADANGSGTFEGSVTGRIARPLLDGEFTLQNHVFRQWKIQQAAGGVRLDTAAEFATLRNARITQGESQIAVNGTTDLSGSQANLQVESNRVLAQDARVFVNRDFNGVFAGAIHVSALSPAIKLEGDVRANNLAVDGRVIGDARGRIRYFEPLIEIDDLSVRQNDSTLTGNVAFNRSNDALKFSVRIASLNLQTFYPLGLPDVVQGVIRQANLRGEGTRTRPNISGDGTIQNLSIQGEVFPQAQVELTSNGSTVDVRLNTGKNVNLTAKIDASATGYPFTAQASFNQYPIERIAKLSEGTINVSGNANLSGSLTDRAKLRGQGRIENANLVLQNVPLRTTKPFTFDFNSDRLNLIGVTLSGQGTQVNVAGAIAFKENAPLNLDVSGQVDLALFATPEWTTTGAVNVQVALTGTPQVPDLRGVAHLANASFRRQGFFTSLSNVNGDLFFARDQVRLDNVAGQIGGGMLRAQGTAVIAGRTLQALNIHIDADNVRFRYPEGLRTVMNAGLDLRGTSTSPVLDGRVQIQSLAYRSSFEDFLAVLTEHNLTAAPSQLGKLRLNLHIEGSRNITIQNQLAEVEARVDVDLKGTLDDPSLTGHIEASGGTLSFQGNRYTVTRGNIDFVDPVRIDPVVDIEAESQVRDYRVILNVAGRGDRLHLSMRSDPPLPELEIVSLIAGGRTREEIATRPGSTSVPTSEQLFQSGAYSVLADLLQQRVGNRLGLLGSGTRVRVDPFLVGAENNPGARITLSEQVTKDLSVTYSQDLSSSRQTVILIEYFVSRNTSVLASRDELGNLGLDVRLRKRIK